MSAHIKILRTDVDVSAIRNLINKNPDDWYHNAHLKDASHNRPQDIGVIQLKMGTVKSASEFVGNSETTVTTDLFKKYKIVDHMLRKTLKFQKYDRCAFLGLEVGKYVGLHIDEGSYYQTRHRFHLCIQGKYEYVCDDEEATIYPGTLFWFNNKKEHGALNTGTEKRITLVFDVPYSITTPYSEIINK